jgi:hypothetical protein
MRATVRRWACGVAVAFLGQLVLSAPAQADPAPPAVSATVAVDPAHPFGALPADFVGLSYEMRELSFGGFDARTGNLTTLLRNLGRGNLRVGGNTLDRDTLWVPDGQPLPQPLPEWVQNVVRPSDIARLGQFLRATGWRAEVGINMGHWDAALAADQARTMSGALGRWLLGVECGNEPNSWVSKGFRPAGFGYPQYRPEWEVCAGLVGGDRLAGPDTSSPRSTAAWVTQFAQDEHARLRMLTAHNYSVPAGSDVTTLLSAQTVTNQLSSLAPQLAAAKAYGLPLRIDETNSAANGGIPEVSDSYASALWALDYSLLMAQAGHAGLNFHGGLGVCGAPLYNGKFQIYTPICAANAADEQARVYQAMPEYYGLLMATRMGTGQFLPVTVTTDRNITGYAVRGRDGRIRIALIEKSATDAGTVHIGLSIGTGSGTAGVVRLTGTSLTSSDGVAIQGATIDRRGRLSYRPAERFPVRGGHLDLDLAAGSAVVIALDGVCS